MSAGSFVRNLVVGCVFLGGLAVVGAITLSLKEVPFLHQAEARSVRFANVDNLQEGDDVKVHGLRVGEVKSIEYAPAANTAAPVLVNFSVPTSFGDLLGGAAYAIHSPGPLGGRYLEITLAPEGGAPAVPGAVPVGKATGDVFRQLATLFEKEDPAQSTLPEVLNNLGEAVREFRDTFKAVNEGRGLLGKAIVDPQMRDDTTKGLTDFFDVIANLKGEKGIIPYLLNNEEAKEELRTAIADVRQILREVREGKGIAGQLLSDEKMAARLEELLDDAHQIVHKVNAGQGTVGQAINNPRAWDEFVKVLVLARETVEDLREQAPVSTFVNAAFSAF